MYCYVVNGRSANPAHQWLTGCSGEMATHLHRIPVYDKWIVEKEAKRPSLILKHLKMAKKTLCILQLCLLACVYQPIGVCISKLNIGFRVRQRPTCPICNAVVF
jgi:hypothetical protein